MLFEQHDEKNGIVLIDRSGKAMWAEFPEGLYDEIIRMFSEKVGSGKSTQYELIDANWSVKILENKEK